MKKIIIALSLVISLCASAENKRYITEIHDFLPAPGQFTNMMPVTKADMTKADVLKAVANSICGYYDEEDEEEVIAQSMISLGSYGGYVIFSFDHPLVNVKGEYDMQIFGNAYQANQSSNSGGSSEPGIVMVANDLNGPWYELAGSEYHNPRTQHDFKITYYKPAPDHVATPDPKNKAIVDTSYVAWTCNSVDSLTTGHVYKNSFHAQSYWPEWYEGDEITFEGSKLRCNAADESGQGTYWVQYFYDWGYVDNRPDYRYNGTEPQAGQNLGFKLDWAVDSEGNHVDIKQVKYIKVYNGVLQQCGWLGETSTEVGGAIDLHPDAVPEPDRITGDVNGDGSVDITDANAIINAILTTKNLPEADVNNDGAIDITDVNALLNIILNGK
ncbi:dockerin type I repeat-containing protein [Sodaliphilus sp.]|uniref:dockerin type I repeat-containing protein n=1 Tax=Sodaliphilus sp. TaxID=2815818 RepID=UPI00388EAEF6